MWDKVKFLNFFNVCLLMLFVSGREIQRKKRLDINCESMIYCDSDLFSISLHYGWVKQLNLHLVAWPVLNPAEKMLHLIDCIG
jgi:hypothetical protein